MLIISSLLPQVDISSINLYSLYWGGGEAKVRWEKYRLLG